MDSLPRIITTRGRWWMTQRIVIAVGALLIGAAVVVALSMRPSTGRRSNSTPARSVGFISAAHCNGSVCAAIPYEDPFGHALDSITVRLIAPIADPIDACSARYGGWPAIYDHGRLIAAAIPGTDVCTSRPVRRHSSSPR
jgi:hypothetical protein